MEFISQITLRAEKEIAVSYTRVPAAN